MADNMLQIHELVPLGRDLTGTDVLAVDTGALTAKVDYDSLKQEITDGDVKFSAAQSLTDSQKAQARGNIGAASAADMTAADSLLGNTALPTTAQTVTGAIAEHETDISGINGKIGAVPSGSNLQGELDDLKSAIAQLSVNAILLDSEIPDTVQSVTFDSAGNVSTITHTNGSNVAVRTDAFTFATNSITEVRTLNTGEKLTIATNTTTLATTVTYTAAA